MVSEIINIPGDFEISIDELERRDMLKDEQISNLWEMKYWDEKELASDFYYWDQVEYLGPNNNNNIEAADYEKIGRGFNLKEKSTLV